MTANPSSPTAQTTTWKIASCNVQGMNNPAKQDDIIQWHIHHHHTISCLSETRLNQQTARFLKNKHPNTTLLHTSDPLNTNGSGAAILINRQLTPHIHSIQDIPGRCITIQLKFRNKVSITISSIYGKANWDKRIARASTAPSTTTPAHHS